MGALIGFGVLVALVSGVVIVSSLLDAGWSKVTDRLDGGEAKRRRELLGDTDNKAGP
jgi:hypothetical protein